LAKSNNITHSKNVKELERLEHEKQKNKKYANALISNNYKIPTSRILIHDLLQ
jgi:hypothetical protein